MVSFPARTPLRLARHPAARARRPLRNEEGVAAVEFALILPVMLMMLLGMTEVTIAVNTDRKLTLLSRSLADLTSRSTTVDGTGTTVQSSIDSSGASNVLAASGVILQPYPTAAIKMVVSSMKATYSSTTKTWSAAVSWSCAKGTGAVTKPTSTTYPVPSGFTSSDTSATVNYVMAETVLPYQPIFGRALTGTINLTENTPWPVRNGSKVKFTGTCPNTGTPNATTMVCNCPDPS